MKKFLMCSAAALAILAAIPSVASAQVVPPPGCPPFCPPGGGAGSGNAGGAGGGQFIAYGIIAVATYYAVFNPQKGSDSILANTIHGEWACARKDKRPKCHEFVRLSRSEQNRLRRLAGLPPH